MDTELNDAIQAKTNAWNAYIDAERTVKAIMLDRNYYAAYRENELRDKITEALNEVNLLKPLIHAPDAEIAESYQEALTTYADLRAELLTINPTAR